MPIPHTSALTITPLGVMAGRKAYAVRGTLTDAEGTPYPTEATVIGDAAGADDPATGVVIVTPSFPGGIHVTDAGRFGPFGRVWVRRFYGLPDTELGPGRLTPPRPDSAIRPPLPPS